MSTLPHWIAIGDIHDDMSMFLRIPQRNTAVGVIVTGDITLHGGIKQAQTTLAPLIAQHSQLYCQIGNMDKPEVNSWLDAQGWNIHANAKLLAPGVILFGAGGSTVTPFNTPNEYSETQMAAWIAKGYAHARALGASYEGTAAYILVSHTPPYSTACDRLSNGQAAGSHAVREFIELYQPDICLCGHIHESCGQDTLGKTVILNPGPLSTGGYVLLELADEAQISASLQYI